MLITNLRFISTFEHFIYEKKLNSRGKMAKMAFFSFFDFFAQNLTPIKNQLHREIEQVLLYRMVYVTDSVNFSFVPN